MDGQKRAKRYGVALLATVLAVCLSLVLSPLAGGAHTPLLLAAVAVSAWYGGRGPGLLAAALSAGAWALLFELTGLPPRLGPGGALRLCLFVAVALVIVALHASRIKALESQGRALAREQDARAAAERDSLAMEEALGTVAHELRTPASAVLGWARVLRTDALDSRSAQHALEVIERNAQLQAHLAGDLSDVARVRAGKLRLDMGRVELAEVVVAAVETMLPAAESEGIEVLCEAGAGPAGVRGDPDRLQQVVVNLLSNAVKFTPGGGRIEVTLERVGTHAQLTVRDTGVGISEALLPHVFERFRQGDCPAAKRHAGLGLGLSLARELVEMHGGTISAESCGEGEGSAFVVRLPLADPHSGAKTQSPERVPAGEAPGHLPAARASGVEAGVVPSARASSRPARRPVAEGLCGAAVPVNEEV